MSQRFKVSLFPVYFVLFIDNFAFAVIFSTFGPLFIDPSYGMVTASMGETTKNLMLGVAFSFFPLGQFFGAPFLGDIADHFGRKKAFYLTITGGIIGFLLSGFSILVHSYVLLLITRLITGFFAGNLSICLASIADLSPDEKSRAKNFSIIVIITGLSWMFAMLSGGYLSDPSISSHFNPSLPFFFTAILSLISLLGVIYFYKETHPMKGKLHIDFLKGFRDIRDSFMIRELRTLYTIYMFWILGWGLAFQWYSPFSLQTFHVSPIEANWGQFIVGITWMLGGYFVNNFIIKRWHPRPWVVAANAMTTLCLLGMALSPSFLPFAFFFMLGCIPSAFAWPNTLNLISINAPPSVQGKVMGISQSAQAIGFILATIFGGIVAATKLDLMYYFTVFFLLISFIMILCFHIKKTASLKQ
ncbi:MAG: MFS transporter [Chlamydiia bacterium]|nr:MFS transporter [Chlamydiia bacterium]